MEMVNPKEKMILKGIPASAGVVEGKVKIVGNGKKISEFKEGDILVARITNPSMVMTISKSAAIITDIGGLTSHPAILSRELGIPCIVGAEKATKVLKNGMKIKVDGKKGIVYEI